MKAARRTEARARRAQMPTDRSGEDPDIAGIVPGPQPSPWGDDDDLDTDSVDTDPDQNS